MRRAGPVAARSGEASRVYDNATSRITYRDPAQVSQLLDGFSLAGLAAVGRQDQACARNGR